MHSILDKYTDKTTDGKIGTEMQRITNVLAPVPDSNLGIARCIFHQHPVGGDGRRAVPEEGPAAHAPRGQPQQTLQSRRCKTLFAIVRSQN